jgi:hypothetical protein
VSRQDVQVDVEDLLPGRLAVGQEQVDAVGADRRGPYGARQPVSDPEDARPVTTLASSEPATIAQKGQSIALTPAIGPAGRAAHAGSAGLDAQLTPGRGFGHGDMT